MSADWRTGVDDGLAFLAGEFEVDRARAAADPFTNPFLLFARALTRRLGEGDDAARLEAVVQRLTVQAFEDRADRLGRYLGPCDPERVEADLCALFEAVADRGDFAAFAGAVAAAPFGMVLTAHPTFALTEELSRLLVELATGRDEDGRPLDEAGRAERLARAAEVRHGPAAGITLAVEHDWSVRALVNARRAMARVYGCVLRVARRRWPGRWTELTPRLLTLATWVGFDQDGRTDITWQVSVGARLALKREALVRRLDAVRALAAEAGGEWAKALAGLAAVLQRAVETVDGQAERLRAAIADPSQVAAFGRAMVAGRDAALVTAGPVLQRLQAALERAPDDEAREALLIMRAGLTAEGVSLARIHVRLNAGQLHDAVRREVGLETEPTDPANRRTYFAAIDRLIATVRPARINFGSLLAEPSSARRLMMTVAQMLKLVDGSTPVRFLIAEIEAGFTLLTALYFARLFGVEDRLEISPLFETREAFERGERVIEEALRSEHFRAYLLRHRRLTIEFGFSDSGRFVGQMAATLRIERLRFRLAQLLEEHGLTDLEVVFFNTHGESIGRGGHPASLADRFRYAAPPRSRAEFVSRGLRVKEEDSFQGGEGYLPLFTPVAALATVRAALETVLADDPEAAGDPIYDDPDFASEFFATVEQDFARVVADPDYAALVGLFGTQLLPKTGSRPVRREREAGRPRVLASVSELRAIPNNAVLQQLGYLANTVFGVGHAAMKDPETFERMRRTSPRFRRALEMAAAAWRAGDLRAIEAYAATLDPALWLDRAVDDPEAPCDRAAARAAGEAGVSDPLNRFLKRLKAEDLAVREAFGPNALPKTAQRRRDRLLLLHALRAGAIQRLCLLAARVPEFSPQGPITRAGLLERLMRLDVPGALERLEEIFPKEPPAVVGGDDFGEPADYAPEEAHGHRDLHEQIFEPIARLYDLILRIGAGVTHDVGAFG